MKYTQKILATLLLGASLILSGCGGNNSDSPPAQTSNSEIPTTQDPTSPTTDPSSPPASSNEENITLVLPVSATVLTTNSQVVNIEVRVFDSFNNPYSEGTITKINPNDVLTGRDIGTFDKDTATLVNGIATFAYTAPSQLDSNTSNITFAFYHSSDSATRIPYTFSINPEENQTVFSSYSLVSSNGLDKTMSLESTKNISYTVLGDGNERIDDSDIISITVSSLNPNLATLKDSSGNTGTELNSTSNAFSINLETNTKSGVVPVKVEAVFMDSNAEEKVITEVFDIVVLSGPPTAMSLSYAGTSQKSENAKFVENWVLTVTDKYSNLINTKPSISAGGLIGYAQSSALTDNARGYLYYSSTSGSGTLSSNTEPATFTADAGAFNNIDLVNDKLVLFGGNGYRFNAFGKWDIEALEASNELSLLDDYNGSDIDDLGFAVGNNFRNEVCSGNSVVANIYAKDGNNILGSDGSMIIQIEYDYYLVGKDIVLWSNLVGSSNNEDVRVGLGKKVTLRGQGLEGSSFSFTDTFTGVVRLFISTANTPESYKNANFIYSVEVTGQGVSHTVVGDSMSDIYSCDASGRAYVDVEILSGGVNGGTVSVTDVAVSNEF